MPLITVKYNINDVHSAVDYILEKNPYVKEKNLEYNDVYNSIMDSIHCISDSYKTKNPNTFLSTMGCAIHVNDTSYHGEVDELVVYLSITVDLFTFNSSYRSLQNFVDKQTFSHHVFDI